MNIYQLSHKTKIPRILLLKKYYLREIVQKEKKSKRNDSETNRKSLNIDYKMKEIQYWSEKSKKYKNTNLRIAYPFMKKITATCIIKARHSF